MVMTTQNFPSLLIWALEVQEHFTFFFFGWIYKLRYCHFEMLTALAVIVIHCQRTHFLNVSAYFICHFTDKKDIKIHVYFIILYLLHSNTELNFQNSRVKVSIYWEPFIPPVTYKSLILICVFFPDFKARIPGCIHTNVVAILLEQFDAQNMISPSDSGKFSSFIYSSFNIIFNHLT